jgi:hypothetical protein
MIKFEPNHTPVLTLVVNCENDAVELRVTWMLSEIDATCWRRPLSLSIAPYVSPLGKWPGEHWWETCIEMSREECRLLRDFLTSVLASPDWRGTVDQPNDVLAALRLDPETS